MAYAIRLELETISRAGCGRRGQAALVSVPGVARAQENVATRTAEI